MADDLSLLLKIRGDAASGKAAVAETRAAIASLRATTATEFGAIQNAGTSAFSSLTDSLNVFVGQRIPLVGGAFVRVTENLRNFGAESKNVEADIAKFNKTVDGIASSTGKSAAEIRTFLGSFVQLEGQAARDAAAIEKFGVANANIIPQLEAAATQLGTMSTVAPEAATGLAGVVGAMGPVGIAAAGIAVEIGLVGIAFGAVTSVAKGLVEQFFALAESAASWRGALLDSSQQLGISVETLSAFEILAKTTGGDLGSITASLGIFQKKLEEAQDPLSKTGKLFSDLGVNTNSTEEALRTALTQLAAMPEGFHQTATALELFGRGGKSILAILKEMHGDLDGAISRFREMGLIVSKEDAVAADKFNDELALLHFRFRALLGNEAIPAATVALEALGKTIDNNQGVVQALGEVVHLAGLSLQGFVIVINQGVEAVNIALGPYRTLASVYERIAAALKDVNANAIPAFTDFSATTGGAGGGLDLASALGLATKTTGAADEAAKEAQKARKEAATRANREIALSLDALEEITRVHLVDLQRERDRDLKNIDEWETTSLQLAHDHRVGLEAVYDQEATNARKFIDNQADLSLALQEIEQKKTKAVNAEIEKRNEIQDKAQRDRDQAELNLNKQLAAIRDTAREGELARIKNALDRQAITESEAKAAELALLKDAQEQRLTLIDVELNQESTSAARKLELDNLRIQSEQKYTDEKKRLTDERIDAANREQASSGPGSQGVGPVTSDDIARRAGAAADIAAGFPPPAPIIDPWKEALSQLKDMGLDAVNSLAAGVGNLTQQWVLYGSVGPNAVRKMVASVLAGLAAQAAMQAVMELAYGFIALTPWGAALYGPASNHFIAAALFASVAAGSAIAGRLVAGNSFQSSNAGSSGKGIGGGTATGGAGAPSSQDTNRLNYQPSVIQVHLHGEAAVAFKYKVIDVIVDDHRDNGRVRTMIETGQV